VKTLNLGQTIGVLANVGVIAGIVFLAVELRQNNELLQAQTSYNLRESQTEVAESIFQNRDLATILEKKISEENLTSIESIPFKVFAERILQGMNWRYQEAQAGREELQDIDELKFF